jgi:carboxylesterase
VIVPVAAAVVAGVVGALLWRRSYARRIEQDCLARRPIGPDGIIVGAEGFELTAPGPRSLLLVHGGGDTPQTLRYLADVLHARGYTVRAPLLPGHGRTVRDFVAVTADAWLDAVRAEYRALRERYPWVGVVGLSMGGALSVILATELPSLPAMVLVAPYVSMPTRVRHAARVAWLWGCAVPYLRGGAADRSIHDPAERAKSLAYGAMGARTLRELWRVVVLAWAALPRVKAPTLVVHSREDHRVPVDAAERAFARLGAPEKRLAWTDRGGHVLTVDVGRERVFALVTQWLEEHRASSARGAAVRPPAVAVPRKAASAG